MAHAMKLLTGIETRVLNVGTRDLQRWSETENDSGEH